MGRRKAKPNPIGMPLMQGVQAVKIGKKGKQTHIYDPNLIVRNADGTIAAKGAPLCLSGFKGKSPGSSRFSPSLYASNANFITCYRCEKLAQMNLRRNGSVFPS